MSGLSGTDAIRGGTGGAGVNGAGGTGLGSAGGGGLNGTGGTGLGGTGGVSLSDARISQARSRYPGEGVGDEEEGVLSGVSGAVLENGEGLGNRGSAKEKAGCSIC